MASWFNIEGKAGTPTIYIYDEIGLFGVSASDFAKELKALGNLKGKNMNLRLNTPGGDTFAGNTIMTLLRESGANITVYVDGVAASMGSAIAMVGAKVIMSEGAMMMIHNPAGIFAGESDDMQNAVTLLDGVKEGMITAYTKKSGLDRDTVSKIMDAETWLTAVEAVKLGFADEIGGSVKVAAFDLARYSRNAPKDNPEAKQEVPMTKEEMEMLATTLGGAVTAANKPVLDALAALKPAAATEKKDAPVASAKTEEDLRKEIKASMAVYASEVREVCALAGLSNLADAYIAAEKPLAEVRADLKAKKVAARDSKPRINNHAPAAKDDGNTNEDEDDISDLVPKAKSHAQIWAKFNGKEARN